MRLAQKSEIVTVSPHVRLVFNVRDAVVAYSGVEIDSCGPAPQHTAQCFMGERKVMFEKIREQKALASAVIEDASPAGYSRILPHGRLVVMTRRIFAALAVLLLVTSTAEAHRLGEGYIILKVADDGVSGRIELNLEDVDDALLIDQNGDGVVNQTELDASVDRIRNYVTPLVGIGSEDAWWTLSFSGHELASYPLGNYVKLPFVVEDAGTVPDQIQIEYRVLFDHDENQKGLLVIEENQRIGFTNADETVSQLFTADTPIQSVDLTEVPTRNVFMLFVKEGVWHIWIGLDHILFLLALLLPSVRKRDEPWWEPVKGFRPAFWEVAKVVTLFTLAHSITLALAALRIVELPSWIVESIIAGSIVVAALDNVVPIFKGRIGWIIFGFGLFHGLGFASVLSHLTLSQTSLVTTLLGFNLGVEIGQIAIICAVFPVLYFLRNMKWYPNVIQRGVSIVLIVMGVVWVIERSFDVTILGI